MKTVKKIVAVSVTLSTLVLVGCLDKEPPMDCDAVKSKDAAVQILSKKFLEDGLKGYSQQDVQKLISIVDIKDVEKSGSYHKCKASLTVAFPADLGSKIGQAFSTVEGRAALRDKLELKFGLVNGPSMYNQINDAISDGPYGVVPQIPTPEQLKAVGDTVTKNAQVIAGAENKVSFTYEIKPEKLADGKEATSVAAYVNDLDSFDLDIVLLSLGGVL